MKIRLLLSIAFIAALVACGGAEERKAVYMEKAKSSIEAGDLDKARIELKNVLQIDPKDSEAYYQIGYIYEQLKDYRKAYANYLKAEELDPNLLENQARLGRFYLYLIKDNVKTQEKIDFVLSKEPNNIEGLLLKAAMLLNEKNEAGAITIANGIVSKEPGHVESVMFLAKIYLSKNKTSEALSILDNALKINQDNERLNKLLALTYVNNKDYENAEKIYLKLLENNPKSRSSYRILAALYITAADKEKAEKILRASIDVDPSDVDRIFDLIKYISKEKDNKTALSELESFVSKNKGMGKLRIAQAEFFYLNNKKEEAIEVYKNAIKDFGDEVTGVEARVALASIYINNKDFIEAEKIIEDAIMVSPGDAKVNLAMAKLALYNNDIEKAIIGLRVVIRQTPENIEAYILLAKCHQLENNKDQIKDTLNNAYINNKSNPGSLLQLAKFYLSNDLDLALKIIDDYSALKGPDYDGLSIKASILNQKKEFSEAFNLAEKLKGLYPDMPNGYLQAIPYYGQQKDMRKAISVLEEGYLIVKDNRKILILLSTLQASENQFDIVERRIKEELKKSPDDPELKIFLAKTYVTNNDTESAEILLKEVIDYKPEIEESYLILSLIYGNRNDQNSVISILKKGKSNVTSSVKIALRLASVYESEKKYKQATDIYRELHEAKPDDLVVINNLISLLSDYGSDDDLQIANGIAEKLKGSGEPVFLDTLGWLHYKLADYQNAILFLSQAVEKAPKVNVFNFHLGMAYKISGDKDKAKFYLEKSLADNKEFTEKELAEAALKNI